MPFRFVSNAVTSGGFRDRGARGRSHLRGPCLKVSEISFQFFLRRGGPSGLPKARGLGPWPPAPPKTATGYNSDSLRWSKGLNAVRKYEVPTVKSSNVYMLMGEIR